MKEKNYVASVRQDSNDIGDAPFKDNNSIEQKTKDVVDELYKLMPLHITPYNLGDEGRVSILINQLHKWSTSSYIEQLKIIYDDLQSNIDGCYVNLNESGLSQKEKGFFLGCASVCRDMKIKIAPLLNSDKNHERSVATDDDSSTEADKPLPNSPVKEDWISVEVEPEFGGEYNVLYDLEDGGSPIVSTMDFDKNEKKWFDTRGANIEITTVTHWQPLPAPPKPTVIKVNL